MCIDELKATVCALCIFFIPLFECFCCVERETSSTCCASVRLSNQNCDVHQCLENLDELGFVKSSETGCSVCFSRSFSSHTFTDVQEYFNRFFSLDNCFSSLEASLFECNNCLIRK